MKVVPFDDIPAADWNLLTGESPDAWLFHRAEWIRIESQFFSKENHSFGVLDDCGTLAAVCPLYHRELGRGRWIEQLLDSGHHRHTGPAFRKGLESSVRKSAITLLMRHLFESADAIDADRILLNANNLAFGNRSHRSAEIPFWQKDFAFHAGAFVGPNGDFPLPNMSTLCADQIVNLSQSKERLFQALNPNFRKAVRKANESGLAIEHEIDDPIDEYYRLAQISSRRTGETLPQRDYYQAIWDSFASDNRARILFAKHQNQHAGAILILSEKGGAQYLAGVFHPDHLPMRVSNFLHWETIRQLKADGQSQYRLGPIFPTLPSDWPVSRVSKFKAGFGAEPRTIIQGSYFRKIDEYLEDTRMMMDRAA